jgi:hypothetical protein
MSYVFPTTFFFFYTSLKPETLGDAVVSKESCMAHVLPAVISKRGAQDYVSNFMPCPFLVMDLSPHP